MPLFNSLENLYHQHGSEKTYWIAYSGGLDSHVLLHLLVNLRSLYAIKLRAIHVNHSLSPNAADWATHCATVCANLDVELTQQTINVTPAPSESPEDAARQGRYSVFADLLQPDDLLLTAQHQDDQAETVLLQLLRGAGPKGLAAMPYSKVLGQGLHLRPLLDFSRPQLEAYAEENHLHWIEDESNNNTDFSRNFIRHDILAPLKKRWPTVTNTLARVAANCAEAQHMLDALALEDLSTVQGSVDDTLSVKKLLRLTPERQRQVLRFWLRQLNFAIPGLAKLQQIQQDMLFAGLDKMPHTAWKDVELRRFRDDIYALPRQGSHDASRIFDWDLQQPLKLPGIGVLHATPMPGQGLRADLGALTIRYRQGSEVCRLPGRTCHHDLKKLLQTWQVPTWQRDRIPLVYVGKKLVAVTGFHLDPDFEAGQGQTGYVIELSRTKKK